MLGCYRIITSRGFWAANGSVRYARRRITAVQASISAVSSPMAPIPPAPRCLGNGFKDISTSSPFPKPGRTAIASCVIAAGCTTILAANAGNGATARPPACIYGIGMNIDQRSAIIACCVRRRTAVQTIYGLCDLMRPAFLFIKPVAVHRFRMQDSGVYHRYQLPHP